MMAAPSVYAAINAITADLSVLGIPKTHMNSVDDYRYRSIDDVLAALAPLLPKYRLCVLPQVLNRTTTDRGGMDGSLLLNVTLHMAFDLVSSDDGSSHRVQAYGEALDPSDKATAKAMSAAYKSAMLQAFCIPVTRDEADATGHKLKVQTHVPAPVQGWEQWGLDIRDIIGVCESNQAIDLVQDRNRELLKAMSREQPDLYADLGCIFQARRDALHLRLRDETSSPPRKRSRRRGGECQQEVGQDA